MDITIRKALAIEAPIIADFQVKMAWETEELELDPDIVQRGVKGVFDDSGKGFYLVAVHKQELIASLMITLEWSDWRAKTVWWIQSLYVIPAYRKKGVFKRMYNHLKETIHHLPDVAGIRLYVDKSNISAMRVYEAIGMDGEHYQLYEDLR